MRPVVRGEAAQGQTRDGGPTEAFRQETERLRARSRNGNAQRVASHHRAVRLTVVEQSFIWRRLPHGLINAFGIVLVFEDPRLMREV
jgi:hypothetical protein